MFSLAYVILPFASTPPAGAIRDSLARFERGGRGDVPDEWLRFHDETVHVETLYRASMVFTKGQGLRIEGGESYYLDTKTVVAEMDRRGIDRWTIHFADVEPTVADFAQRYLPRLEQHPVTGGFGQWLNALGRWDWWDLGGRFNGAITGSRGTGTSTSSEISSGPSRGRDVLIGLEAAFDDALDQPRREEVDVRTDNNVELVDCLRDDLHTNEEVRRPGALVLPPGSVDDELRWIANWPNIGPTPALDWLGLPADAAWQDVVRAVYDRFPEHWAAGVAFHL